MAVSETRTADRLAPIVDEVARALGRHGISEGGAAGAKAVLRITEEADVERIVQVYWTAFAANVPGRSIGLHLEVAEPRVHWAEGYLSPDHRNWVFCFHERASDGDIQLAYHGDYATPPEALEAFFDLSAWYVLTATDLTWSDVVYEAADSVGLSEHQKALAGTSTTKAVQESLKKSTIIWLRWSVDGESFTMPVWFLYDQKVDRILVLSGERQQRLPGAAHMREADVILRWKGQNARVAEIPASVRVLEPGPEWDDAAEKIAEKRLNIPGLPEDTARRWRDECDILELRLRT
jgi:hypothetical protein